MRSAFALLAIWSALSDEPPEEAGDVDETEEAGNVGLDGGELEADEHPVMSRGSAITSDGAAAVIAATFTLERIGSPGESDRRV
ncbi:MAG TPA: hypothetical protein VF070_33030 [Streptosporangiaceae bacterium]